ncbi:MAG: phage tail protein [Ilumatobacteraceae bacterium]
MNVDGSDTAVSVYFEVNVDGFDLGPFTGCDGLGCEVVMEQREEGGLNTYVHQLPGRIKYTNVKLTRPVTSDTAKIAVWLASLDRVVKRTHAQIIVKNHDARPVFAWNLSGVVPVRWQGPSLSVDSPKIATETLELAHHGFLDPGAL